MLPDHVVARLEQINCTAAIIRLMPDPPGPDLPAAHHLLTARETLPTQSSDHLIHIVHSWSNSWVCNRTAPREHMSRHMA